MKITAAKQVHGDVPAQPVQVLMDFRAAGHRKQHQAGQAGTAQEMRLPEGRLERIGRETKHLGLAARGQSTQPTDESEGSAVDRLRARQRRHERPQVVPGSAPSKAGKASPWAHRVNFLKRCSWVAMTTTRAISTKCPPPPPATTCPDRHVPAHRGRMPLTCWRRRLRVAGAARSTTPRRG